jgi:hypothetical protein
MSSQHHERSVAPDALTTFVAALWGTGAGTFYALMLAVAMFHRPDGLPEDRIVAEARASTSQILKSSQSQDQPEHREKTFFLLTLLCGTTGGYLGARKARQLNLRNRLLLAGTLLLPVVATAVIRFVIEGDLRSRIAVSGACLMLAGWLARRSRRLPGLGFRSLTACIALAALTVSPVYWPADEPVVVLSRLPLLRAYVGPLRELPLLCLLALGALLAFSYTRRESGSPGESGAS